MGINYFICLITIWAFHQILDTGGLYLNYTTPAIGMDEIDAASNIIGDGITGSELVDENRYLKISDVTRDYVSLRLNQIYFCNNTIYTCLITVQCRDATTEEKDYLLEEFQSTQNTIDDDNENTINNIELQIG